MKNSLLKKTGLFCLSFFLFTCTTLPKEVAPLVYNGGRQNVILMIGDGMGLNHIKAAQAVYGDLFITTAEKTAEGEVTTYSLNALPTDSAAAATALATGNKTRNGQIGQLNGEAFESTSERALSLKMAAGVVATEGVDGATPGRGFRLTLRTAIKSTKFLPTSWQAESICFSAAILNITLL